MNGKGSYFGMGMPTEQKLYSKVVLGIQNKASRDVEQKLLSAKRQKKIRREKKKENKKTWWKKIFTFSRVTASLLSFYLVTGFFMSWWTNFLTYASKVIRTNNMPTKGITEVFYLPAFLHQLLVLKWGICHVKGELDPRLGIIWPWNINCNHKRTSQPFIFWSCVCIRALEHNFYAKWHIFVFQADTCLALLAPWHGENTKEWNAVQLHHTAKGLTTLYVLLLEFRGDGWDRIRSKMCIGLAPLKGICRTYWSLCLCPCQKTQSVQSSLDVSSPTPRLICSFFVLWWHWDIYLFCYFFSPELNGTAL